MTFSLIPMFYRGSQEGGLRPGTENTPMALGMGVAARLVTQNLGTYEASMRDTRDYLRDQLIRNLGLVIDSSSETLQPVHLNLLAIQQYR